jgi:hypothetical protein
MFFHMDVWEKVLQKKWNESRLNNESCKLHTTFSDCGGGRHESFLAKAGLKRAIPSAVFWTITRCSRIT